jgi:hypothetical protein
MAGLYSMKKETEFQVGRDGKVIGLFSCVTALSKASVGTLRPSDYAYIMPRSKGNWVHLYKVLRKVYDREFFDELGESELDKELKAEMQKAKEFLKLYKKAFAKETDKKKLKELCAKIVEYEELLHHLGGIKERILVQKAEWKADEKRDLEEDRKAIEAEAKEKKQRAEELLKDLIEVIKKAKQGGEDYDSFEDWWVEYQSLLCTVSGYFLGREMGEVYWKAFKRIRIVKGELTALAGKVAEVELSEESPLDKKEAERLFTAFLIKKGVWAC